MDYLAILTEALKGKVDMSGVIYKAQRKAEINEFIYRTEFYDKIKYFLKSIETNQIEKTGIHHKDVVTLKNAISEAECMFDPYFTLSSMIIYDWSYLEKEIMSKTKKEIKLNFIDDQIAQSGVDRFIKLWLEDCSICSKQFVKKPAWEGVIDSYLGEIQEDKLIEKSAYLSGVLHYENYINLKLLREKIKNNNYVYKNIKHKSFDSKLTKKHIEELVICINDSNMFESIVDSEQLMALFNCTLSNPIKVNNNMVTSMFFNILKNGAWICEEWQAVIEKNCLLEGKRGAILGANHLSTALSKVKTSSKDYLKFDKVISGLK